MVTLKRINLYSQGYVICYLRAKNLGKKAIELWQIILNETNDLSIY